MNTSYLVSPEKENLFQEFFENRSGSKIFVLTDRNTKRHCWPLIKDFFPLNTRVLTLPAGENHKNLATCEKVWEWLTLHHADRNALLVCLGGGVVGDLGGFCASVFKRGIPFVLVPTSLLAMADACLGGKTGVDFQLFKNQLGTFSAAEKALIWPGFLKTLPQTELLSGFAEVIKHALIADAPAWQLLRKRELSGQDWEKLIQASLAAKARIVEKDPFEAGERQKLNAGHTLGHALESFFLKSGKPLPHGHCVAAGLVMESRIALEKGLLQERELIEMEELIFSLYGKIEIRRRDFKTILRLCLQDKKNLSGKVRMALIGPLGNCHTGVDTSREEQKMAIEYYNNN